MSGLFAFVTDAIVWGLLLLALAVWALKAQIDK